MQDEGRKGGQGAAAEPRRSIRRDPCGGRKRRVHGQPGRDPRSGDANASAPALDDQGMDHLRMRFSRTAARGDGSQCTVRRGGLDGTVLPRRGDRARGRAPALLLLPAGAGGRVRAVLRGRTRTDDDQRAGDGRRPASREAAQRRDEKPSGRSRDASCRCDGGDWVGGPGAVRPGLAVMVVLRMATGSNAPGRHRAAHTAIDDRRPAARLPTGVAGRGRDDALNSPQACRMAGRCAQIIGCSGSSCRRPCRRTARSSPTRSRRTTFST